MKEGVRRTDKAAGEIIKEQHAMNGATGDARGGKIMETGQTVATKQDKIAEIY